MSKLVFQKVAALLAEILGIDDEDISMNTKLSREEGITSVDIAKLIIECERTVQVRIHDEDVHGFQYVTDLVTYIKRLQEEEQDQEKVPVEKA